MVSHESALDLLGLSDAVPEMVHLTVPRSKRYHIGNGEVIVHTTMRPIRRTDAVIRDGMRVTGPVRSIIDSAEVGMAPEQIVRAADQALERGVATRLKLLAAARAE